MGVEIVIQPFCRSSRMRLVGEDKGHGLVRLLDSARLLAPLTSCCHDHILLVKTNIFLLIKWQVVSIFYFAITNTKEGSGAGKIAQILKSGTWSQDRNYKRSSVLYRPLRFISRYNDLRTVWPWARTIDSEKEYTCQKNCLWVTGPKFIMRV